MPCAAGRPAELGNPPRARLVEAGRQAHGVVMKAHGEVKCAATGGCSSRGLRVTESFPLASGRAGRGPGRQGPGSIPEGPPPPAPESLGVWLESNWLAGRVRNRRGRSRLPKDLPTGVRSWDFVSWPKNGRRGNCVGFRLVWDLLSSSRGRGKGWISHQARGDLGDRVPQRRRWRRGRGRTQVKDAQP